MTRFRILVSDYDLTLVDSLMDFYHAFAEALRSRAGKSIDFDTFYRHFESDNLNDLIPERFDKNDFWRFFRAVYSSRFTYPYSYTSQFLRMVKSAGARVVIVTGRYTHSSSIWDDLRRFGLDEYVDEVYTAYDIHLMRGSEEYVFDKTWLLKWITSKHGARPCEVVYVGDYTSDLKSALKAGVRFVGVAREDGRRKILEENGARAFRDLVEVSIFLFSDTMLGLPCSVRQAP